MELKELVDMCITAVRTRGSNAAVYIKVPRRAEGNRIRLTPHEGPFGQVLDEYPDFTVAAFSATEVIKWVKNLADDAGKESGVKDGRTP